MENHDLGSGSHRRHSLSGLSLAAVAVAGFSLLSSVALAGNAVDSGDTGWLLTATALVLFMTLPGLSLFYGGLVQSRNVLTVLMQCFAIACIASLLWFIVGYSLSFSAGGPLLGDLQRVFLWGLTTDSLSGQIPEALFVAFQMSFAIITPALIIGAFAERMRFAAVLLFSGLWLLLVYVPLAHWIWGGGWLARLGVLDFAGGLVVHLSAGVAALVAAVHIGPRLHFPDVKPPHNLTMTITGAGMLWVGWFGFNAGSALAADGSAAMALLVTHLSAATAALTWLCREWRRFGTPSSLGVVTGMVAGLGAITPASGYVGPAGAVLIGLLAGSICFEATIYLKKHLRIDDALDVFPVHGVGGLMGTLLLALLAHPALGGASLELSMAKQFGVQLLGVLVVAIYVAVLTWLILKLVGAMTPLRVDEREETEGLDMAQQNESGYKF